MPPEKPTILVVDDDPSLLQSYVFLLGVGGYRAVTALNGDEAREALRAHSPQVALVDLRIRTENGIEVAAELKQMDPLMETIIITGYPSYETAVQALKMGAFDYLAKTTESESILETIQEALHHRESRLPGPGPEVQAQGGVSIAIVCRNTLIQKGVLHLLARSSALRLSSLYSDLNALLKRAHLHAFDLLLVCGRCSLEDRAAAASQTQALRQVFPHAKVVVFNEDYPDETKVELIKHGVSGFLETDISEAAFEKLLLGVHRGEIKAPTEVLFRALTELSQDYCHQQPVTGRGGDAEESALTAREKEIIRFLARGLRNRDIAAALFISEKTVKTHINNIFRKLGAENRLQAITIAYEKKLVL